ncbi:DUF2306 domain-containing protein [Lacibacterium aquatile]|uniref:DUF2306 domain-containing protein n=1 Tax=Lacibacterium aquatile TaxID=1168082 RepID=A0ABW5DRB4_9PROT
MEVQAIILPLHIAAALLAVPVGAAQFWRRKGGRAHRWLGWLWVVLMAIVAVGSFWIRSLMPGGFSPVHILSAMTVGLLIAGVLMARRGQINRHRRMMIGLYCGLTAAGLATLAPTRLIGDALFG